MTATEASGGPRPLLPQSGLEPSEPDRPERHRALSARSVLVVASRAWREPLAVIGAVLLAVLVVIAVFAPQLAPFDPKAITGRALGSPSSLHLLGTNDVGQDIFSELLFGARSSLVVAAGAATLSLIIGTFVGAGAGLVGGLVDLLSMRVVDMFLAIPLLPLLVLVAALVGANTINVVLVVGLMTWPATARIARSQTRHLRNMGFIEAARGLGGGPCYLLRRHLVPGLNPVLVAGFVSVAAHAVLLEAGLAFLGLADPTTVSWGQVLNRALLHQGLYFSSVWIWWVLPAGLAITMAVLAFTFLGVGLEPIFNPRQRSREA